MPPGADDVAAVAPEPPTVASVTTASPGCSAPSITSVREPSLMPVRTATDSSRPPLVTHTVRLSLVASLRVRALAPPAAPGPPAPPRRPPPGGGPPRPGNPGTPGGRVQE